MSTAPLNHNSTKEYGRATERVHANERPRERLFGTERKRTLSYRSSRHTSLLDAPLGFGQRFDAMCAATML